MVYVLAFIAIIVNTLAMIVQFIPPVHWWNYGMAAINFLCILWMIKLIKDY